MEPHVFIRGWPSEEDPEASDVLCRECGEWSRLNPGDGFVPQVRIFLRQHRHDGIDLD